LEVGLKKRESMRCKTVLQVVAAGEFAEVAE